MIIFFINRLLQYLKNSSSKETPGDFLELKKNRFKDGDIISIFGTSYLLRHHTRGIKKACIEVLDVLPQYQLNIYCQSSQFHSTVIKLLYKQSKAYFNQQSAVYADKLNVTFNRVTIKDLKGRWGSCSSLKNLNYSWRLSLAPLTVANYLCVHEVCHLKEMNHSKSFWNLVQSLDADYEFAKQWLKQNGMHLMKISKI